MGCAASTNRILPMQVTAKVQVDETLQVTYPTLEEAKKAPCVNLVRYRRHDEAVFLYAFDPICCSPRTTGHGQDLA
jgi:hypothetical protein